MPWIGKKVNKVFDGGIVAVTVRYSDGMDSFVEVYRDTVIRADWPDGQIRDREAQLNAVDLTAIKLGARDDAPVIVPVPPTQDELDKAEFLVLVDSFRRVQSEVKAGVGKSTQADLDALVIQIKAAYKDEYAPFLVGLF